MNTPWELEGEADELWTAIDRTVDAYEHWIQCGPAADIEATDQLILALQGYRLVISS